MNHARCKKEGLDALTVDALEHFSIDKTTCCRCGRPDRPCVDFLMPHMQSAQQLCGDCIGQIMAAAIVARVFTRDEAVALIAQVMSAQTLEADA